MTDVVYVNHDFINPPLDIETDIPKLAESRFRTYWLPRILSGNDATLLSDWTEYVSPRLGLPVQVVDDGTKEVMFWIPALVKTPVTYVDNTFNTAIMEYANIAENISGPYADRYIKPLVDMVVARSAGELEQAQWKFILEGYNLLKSATNNPGKQQATPDDFEEVATW